jgi:type 2 lantibiotic biosynthesis protein LanM
MLFSAPPREMLLTMTNIRDLAARASTLFDRLAGGYTPTISEPAEARLNAWRKKAANGNDTQFARRLAWLGITPESVLPLLGDVTIDGPLPSWAAILEDALQRDVHSTATETEPFAHLLRVFVPRDVEAPQELIDDLIQRLSYIAGPTLYLEFKVARAQGVSYDAFAAQGIAPILEGYPALARLLSLIVEMWTRNTRDFLRALDDDRAEIERMFNDGAPVGEVVAIAASHSDTHDGGRTVTIVTFASGLRLVHKPRDIGIEVSWFALLDFLNGIGGELKLLRVLDRGTHGWVEMALPEACRNEAEAHRYYVRAGMLLAVLYALEASDCFFENIVACGAWPVLIDMETLMHHVLRRVGDLAPAEEAADDMLFDSVLRAGFLPSWEAAPDGSAIDISGLAAEVGQVTPYQKRMWRNINTDDMTLDHVPIIVDSDAHLPRIGDRTLRAADYIDDVADGFRTMYRILSSRREDIEPYLADLGRREIRVVFHATRIYGLLLKRLGAPQHMRSGIDRSIETDVISRFYLDAREKADLWPILEAEIAAMEQLDIPRFAVRADSRALLLPTGRVIENAFDESGVDRARRRIASLNDADLELQIGFIRASLTLSAVSFAHDAGESAKATRSGATLTPDDLIAEAVRIGDELQKRAIWSHDGSATWIGAQLLPSASRHQLRPLRMDLYGGLAGVALFFAALERVAPGSGASMARGALSPLRRYIGKADPKRLARDGYTIGAATGTGSFIYALTRCAEFLGDPELLDDARTAARTITDEWIASDDALDAMSGAAGAVIALLALHRATGDDDVLARAVRCGEHLLEKRQWTMTGLSHGAAGISLALFRLGDATGDARFLDAAREAIAYEDSLFDAEEGNWPDLRYKHRSFMNAWCHGAAGIGMARLAGAAIDETPAICRDIDAARAAILREGAGAKDGLCCGALGRAELLVALHDDRAIEHASAVVERARASGGYRLSGRSGADFFDPSLFQGLAGIGYELLRIARPAEVASVLVWE